MIFHVESAVYGIVVVGKNHPADRNEETAVYGKWKI
jgi:hypothetical protein